MIARTFPPLCLALLGLGLSHASSAVENAVFHWTPGEKPRDFARADDAVLVDVAGKLKGANAATLEAWVLLRRVGEQTFAGRGLPSIGPGGERFFRRADGRVNFFIGTDAGDS
jgi:hypothetical protein